MGKLITIIGRGHSGTRAISHTLSASGVFMGNPLNKSGDLVPPQAMYEACRVMAGRVRQLDGLQWDFQEVLQGPIDARFKTLLNEYLKSVTKSSAEVKGWKIPETTLVFPWVARLFPEAYYIHWVRDPRDGVLARHKTDDLADFGIRYPKTQDIFERRAISWKYQQEIVRATPPPQKFLTVRFEDFVLDQENTLARLEEFLGLPLARIEVRPESVGRWRSRERPPDFPCWREDLAALGYERPTSNF